MTGGMFSRGVAVMMAAAAALAGCALGPPSTPKPMVHDLDGAPVQPFSSNLLRHMEVRGPSWLASPAMNYRLLYQTASQRLVYARNRWAASPAEMVQIALGRGLGGAPGRPGVCTLRVSLESFIQEFESSDKSRVVIQAQLALLGPNGALLARRHEMVDAAAAPDPEGGVVAYQGAVTVLASRVDHWLQGLDPGTCRPWVPAGRTLHDQ